MVNCLPPNQNSGVRFPYPVPFLARISGENDGFIAHLAGLDFLTRYQVCDSDGARQCVGNP